MGWGSGARAWTCKYVLSSTLSIYSTMVAIVLKDYDTAFLYHFWFSFRVTVKARGPLVDKEMVCADMQVYAKETFDMNIWNLFRSCMVTIIHKKMMIITSFLSFIDIYYVRIIVCHFSTFRTSSVKFVYIMIIVSGIILSKVNNTM